jgi:flagellar basal-body rod modification protein FlgD
MAVTSSISPTLPASTAAATGDVAAKSLANNFTTFLQLLTTQLKNQNPLDPLDTNQFTQQLVQFAQVEQQMRSNDQLSTLVALQKATQSSAALNFVGSKVVVDGATARLTGGQATWGFSAPRPATATLTIQDSRGQTVYSSSFTVQAGQQNFVWDGRDTNGRLWPDGEYKLSVTAKDANGQGVAISTEVEGVVDSADLTKTPPVLGIGKQNFTLDKIKRVLRNGS